MAFEGLQTRIKMAPKSIFFLVGVFLSTMYYFTSYDGGVEIEPQITQKQEELQKLEKSLEETKIYLADKDEFRRKLNTVSEQYRQALDYLPATFNTQDLLKRIANEARTAGVDLTLVKPQNPEPKGFYEELKMDVDFEGTFPNLMNFLSFISKVQRIITIKNVEITTKEVVDNNSLLVVRGTLVSYRYLEGQ